MYIFHCAASDTTKVVPFSGSFGKSIKFRVSFILGPSLTTGVSALAAPFFHGRFGIKST